MHISSGATKDKIGIYANNYIIDHRNILSKDGSFKINNENFIILGFGYTPRVPTQKWKCCIIFKVLQT